VRRSRLPVWLLPLVLIMLALAVMAAARTISTVSVVDTFPIPGARVASPQTQITFRGVPAHDLGRIAVSGSRTGRHRGRVVGDSDGHGGSFLPRQPFAPGEVVTVKTGLRIKGAYRGTFRFTVATPAGAIPATPLPPATRMAGDVFQFQSRPDLTPPAVQVATKTPADAPGDIFLGPQVGPLQNGPMIVDANGNLVWFKPMPVDQQADDVRVQTLHGKPALTWWQGRSGAGIGFGEDVIYDSSYRQTHVVRAGNGLSADLHEFWLTPRGTALITAYEPVYWNASSAHASAREIVLDAVVQEIDINTGLVLFQWDSLDHVPVTESEEPLPAPGQPFDYFHVNSIQQTADGNLIVSARNTWAAYDIDGRTGQVLWTLGGKNSSFKMGRGTAFAFQHDVRVRSDDGTLVTVFDDGAGPPTVHDQSRAMTVRLDYRQRTATLVRQNMHSPDLLANYEGNTQLLDGGDQFVGWGQQPYFTEFDPSGHIVFDGRFVDANSSYRVYRYPWVGTPKTPPTIAASANGGSTIVYASWNGATEVASWRVLGGNSRDSMRTLGTAAKHGFETQISVGPAPFVCVQALSRGGHVLATSKVVSTGASASPGT
jgi:hypothetical protein